MLKIVDTATEPGEVERLREKLSLKPLLLEGIDEEDGGKSVFGTVRGILRQVQKRGDAAVLEYTEKFDGVQLTPQSIRVSADAVDRAVKGARAEFVAALDTAIGNIRRYQEAMLSKEPAMIEMAAGGGGRGEGGGWG